MSDDACSPCACVDADATPDCLGYLLNVLGHRWKSKMEDGCRILGIGPRDFFGLDRISSLGRISQTELARALCLDRTSTMQLTDRLEQQGWISRVPDAVDRRVNRLELTEPGAAKLAEATAHMDAIENDFCRALNAAERETLISLLGWLY